MIREAIGSVVVRRKPDGTGNDGGHERDHGRHGHAGADRRLHHGPAHERGNRGGSNRRGPHHAAESHPGGCPRPPSSSTPAGPAATG